MLFRSPAAKKKVRQFLSQHCLACHGAKKQSGKRRFDTLKQDFSRPATARTWQAILDQLVAGKMPPRKRPRPEPTALRSQPGTTSARGASGGAMTPPLTHSWSWKLVPR